MVALGKIERDRSDLIAYARRGGIVSVNGFGLSGPFIDALLALDVDSNDWATAHSHAVAEFDGGRSDCAIESLSCGKARIDISLLEGAEITSIRAAVVSRRNRGMAGLGSTQPRFDAVSRCSTKRCRSPARATSSAGHCIAPTAAAEGDTAIVILNQGPLDRSGAHRMSLKCARRWAAHGFPVLRFDARGVGDSEGDWAIPEDGAPIKMLYKNIEEGAWTADTRAAVDHVCAMTSARNVVLTGACGGAVSALHAAAEHPAVVGVHHGRHAGSSMGRHRHRQHRRESGRDGSQGLRQETRRD